MEKMKYNISARTTILIGREGVSRADGAIIELIKNTYDADADFCYIAFDYQNDKLFILDNGIGMTKRIIQDCWMLIGTDNKKYSYLSDKKRVKSGEKGIGRFALDRLGSKCTMYTKNKSEPLIYWFNDWDKFEEIGKTLDDISADFEFLEKDFIDIIPKVIIDNLKLLTKEKTEELTSFGKEPPSFSLETGTFFVIEGLRDKWDYTEINKIFSVLGFLVPPGEQSQYFLFAQTSADKPAEEIQCQVIDDFDYKVIASFDGESVKATIYRNEYDLNIIPKDLFEEDAFKVEPYTFDSFEKGVFKREMSLSELTGNSNPEFLEKAKEVGPFQFQYIFMKLGGGEGNYYTKAVNAKRKLWMQEHGGIKIYRDNFVVRPYGDPSSKSYDWLGLDARKGGNPVAVSNKSEKWHVNNSQIQGTVLISRTNNSSILDKADREGVIENEYFDVLTNILQSIISLFEKDRAYIAHHIKEYRDKKDKKESIKHKASGIASEILNKKQNSKKKQTQAESDNEQMAKAVKIYEEEREELISEIKLLRALATNGLMTTTMAHDLKTINSLLVARVNGFRIALNKGDQTLIERNLNDLKTNDEFLKAWISVITTQSNKDRRKRLKKDIVKTIETSLDMLSPILIRKKVSIEVNTNQCVAVRRIFETDFDSIIYNLIINSIESFESTKCANRKITISLEQTDNKLCIHYLDNGHGLSDGFKSNPYEIFKYGTTSKFDSKGNQIGTGLGMYIVASSVNEYRGTYAITKITEGFGLDIFIPIE